jgi:hypothetical protein
MPSKNTSGLTSSKLTWPDLCRPTPGWDGDSLRTCTCTGQVTHGELPFGFLVLPAARSGYWQRPRLPRLKHTHHGCPDCGESRGWSALALECKRPRTARGWLPAQTLSRAPLHGAYCQPSLEHSPALAQPHLERLGTRGTWEPLGVLLCAGLSVVPTGLWPWLPACRPAMGLTRWRLKLLKLLLWRLQRQLADMVI